MGIYSSHRVINYYAQCYADYRRFWGTERNLSIHYGFHDSRHRTHGDALENMNRVLARIALVKRTDSVLDAGCGVGGSAIWIAKNYGARVIGVNIHRTQLSVARRLACREGVESNPEFLAADFEEMPLAGKSFDLVWGLESICYAESKKGFLREADRILKKGGRIVIADGFLSRGNLSAAEREDVDRWLRGWAVPHLTSTEEFGTYLEDLSFQEIVYRNITPNVLPSSKRMFATGVLTYPFGKYLELVRLRSRTQAGHLVAIFHQYLTLRRGLWEYGVFSARKR
jgi:tocopherol O-methyltransferase